MDTTQDAPTTGPQGHPGPEGPTEGPQAVPEPSLAASAAEGEARDTQRTAVKFAASLGADEIKGSLTTEAQANALDWFLSDEEIPMESILEVDIGPPGQPRPYEWVITTISSDTLKRIRAQAADSGNRARKRRIAQAGAEAEVDEQEANARIVVAGSAKPNLIELARTRGAPETSTDPQHYALELLRHRLRHKPGLIDQLAGKILLLSGYDDEDIREHEAGKA